MTAACTVRSLSTAASTAMRTCRPGVPRHLSWLSRLYLPGLRRGRGHDGCMTQDLPPRATDIFRHLSDLRSGTYEGARQWPERVEVFRRAVSLLDPVVRRVLEQANAVFLRGSGTIHHRAGDDRDGGAYAHWELSERIYQGTWQVIPAFTSQDANAAH